MLVAEVEIAPLRRAVVSSADGSRRDRPIVVVESTEPIVVGRELADVSLHVQMVAHDRRRRGGADRLDLAGVAVGWDRPGFTHLGDRGPEVGRGRRSEKGAFAPSPAASQISSVGTASIP